MNLSMEIILLLFIIVMIISVSAFLIIRCILIDRKPNQILPNNKTKKELMLEVNYTVDKYIESLRNVDDFTGQCLSDNLDRTISDLVYLVLFEYSNAIDSNMPQEDVGMYQDLLELYLTRDLYIILVPKLEQIYNVDLTKSTEQSELTDLVENFTHTLIDSMVLGIKRYAYISKTFSNIEAVLNNSTRKIFDELRMSIGRLSSIRTTHDDNISNIRKEAAEKVYKLIEELLKTENEESID